MNSEINDLLLCEGAVFRTKELNEQGITNYKITKLLENGVLIKVYQGVYAIGDFEKIAITDINVIVENGVLSLKSAAFYYKLVDGDDGKIEITLNREHKPPKLPYDLFCYYYTSSKFYDIGLRIIDQNGRQIRIYDKERTVCDIIRHRSKYDSLLIREVLENYMKDPEHDIDKLLQYAQELRIKSVVLNYLEILGGYDGYR